MQLVIMFISFSVKGCPMKKKRIWTTTRRGTVDQECKIPTTHLILSWLGWKEFRLNLANNIFSDYTSDYLIISHVSLFYYIINYSEHDNVNSLS